MTLAPNPAGRKLTRKFRFLVGLPLACAIGLAQNPKSETVREGPLVRVTVDLVQVDVIVTDQEGRHVTDLTPEDFEILENGKPQRITNFSFIPGERRGVPAATSALPANRKDVLSPPAAAARIAPGHVDRTIAVVVDDLGLSQESFANIRGALERLVDQPAEPGDLIAIITTSGRLGAPQQLTADKRLLHAAVAKLRSIPNHRPGVEDNDFTCVWFNHRFQGQSTAGIQDEDLWLGSQICRSCPPGMDPQQELINDRRSDYYGRLSIAALRRVVDGLRELPGRKSILLFSEGIPLVRAEGLGDVNESLKDAYDAFLMHADRSGVAVSTIDPRGLIPASAAAESGHSPNDECAEARQIELVNTQLELAEMARRTGGISVKDDNDFPGAIDRVMNDQLGYYLIGYKPSEHPAKAGHHSPQFRKMSIRVARPGLTVRFHSSLYEEEEDKPSPEDGIRRLAAAVASPFAIPNIHVKISSRFWDAGAPAGSILDTTLQIDARDLVFSTESDGRHKASFDILAFIYGAESKPLDTFNKTYAVSLTADAYQKALADGMVQHLEMAVKRPGAYQVRGAVRDREDNRFGSASDFVEVPDLTHGELVLSGIALSASPGASSLVRYHPGQTVFYACQVLNAQPGLDGSLHVEVRATLFRDRQALGSSKPTVVDEKGQPDRRRLVVTGNFQLGKQLHPGTYTLQVTSVDRNAPASRGTASQSIDFEVTERK
jgi:VWFA-related protein